MNCGAKVRISERNAKGKLVFLCIREILHEFRSILHEIFSILHEYFSKLVEYFQKLVHFAPNSLENSTVRA